ncbi:acyltransferase [Nocardioides sp.]|uniref:acyltransferase family protein n=1 Tax=Nocardioides sp. TaxID=35761 RepID=UPI00286C0AF7|nr:acyltransferase [Nocardioides sp.]
MPSPRLDSLTGLRFPAALAVFAFHASVHSTPGDVRDVALAIAGRGYTGVSFFFVLSGFVLTWSLRSEDTPVAFYRRRFARIAPTYWVCLVGALLLQVLGTRQVGEPLLNAVPSFLAVQAWWPWEAIHYGANGPGWSISAEMFFYAVFPLLLLVARSSRGPVGLGVLAAVLALGPALVLQPASADATTAGWFIYVLPLTRLADFVVGILLALAMRRGWRPAPGLGAALALTAALYAVSGVLPVWATVNLATLAGFALVIAAAAGRDVSGRGSIWTSPLAVRLGEWSFAFYLVQASVLKVQHEAVKVLGLGAALEWVTVLLALAVSLALAALLHTVVERPFERRLRGGPAGASVSERTRSA